MWLGSLLLTLSGPGSLCNERSRPRRLACVRTAVHSADACAVCGRDVPHASPDPCLGRLPGVLFACCGHGTEKGGYIVFANGVTVRSQSGFLVDDVTNVVCTVGGTKHYHWPGDRCDRG